LEVPSKELIQEDLLVVLQVALLPVGLEAEVPQQGLGELKVGLWLVELKGNKSSQ
jgi:hypothetical protein